VHQEQRQDREHVEGDDINLVLALDVNLVWELEVLEDDAFVFINGKNLMKHSPDPRLWSTRDYWTDYVGQAHFIKVVAFDTLDEICPGPDVLHVGWTYAWVPTGFVLLEG